MFREILSQKFLNNEVESWLTALVIFVVGIIAVKIFKSIILSRLRKWAEKTKFTLDDFLINNARKTVVPLLYYAALYIAAQSLILHPKVSKGIYVLGLILLTFFGVRFALSLAEYSFRLYLLRKQIDIEKEKSYKGILPALKIIVWGVGILLLLDNLGVKISTVVAGLGIGGIAVALAAQAVLGDLFSYFAILFDRPFEVGDFIIVGDFLGTVEYIGIKTTRVRSLGGEQLVFSNTDLTNSRIRNYKRMAKRRVVFKLGVTYQTTLEQLKEIPTIIRNTIDGIDDAVLDRVHFFSYGDFSLVYEIVYYVMNSDYNIYMDIQQDINLKIKEEFEKRSIEFAYPTQTLFLAKEES